MDWLKTAQKLLTEKNIDSKEFIETEKVFFENADQNRIKELEAAAKELKACLPKSEQQIVDTRVDNLQQAWKEAFSIAPPHLIRSEFSIDLSTYNHLIKDMEKELISEQQAFNKHANIEELLARHNEFFADDSLYLREARELINSLARLSAAFESVKESSESDTPLNDAFGRVSENWDVILSNIAVVKKQLERVPEQWKEFVERMNELSAWMESADKSIKDVLQDLQTAEEFDDQKVAFQDICRDVDKKKDEVMWLVQTCDMLSQYYPNTSARERAQLQELVNRYKSLMPTVEVTITRTKLYSRCYTYKKEVTEVCQLLQKVREDIKSKPKSIETIDQLVHQQQEGVNLLNEHRSNVLSLIQRGKQLARDSEQSPEFLGDLIKNLEQEWEDSYSKTIENLNRLKETQKVWIAYQEQRDHLMALLKRAENELKDVPTKYGNSKQLEAELISKKELKAELKKATEIQLAKLKDLSGYVVTIASPDRVGIINEEIEAITNNLEACQQKAETKTENLEKLTSTWSEIESNVKQVKTWTDEHAPSSMLVINSSILSPEERAKTTQQLQNQLTCHISTIDKLSDDVDSLIGRILRNFGGVFVSSVDLVMFFDILFRLQKLWKNLL